MSDLFSCSLDFEGKFLFCLSLIELASFKLKILASFNSFTSNSTPNVIDFPPSTTSSLLTKTFTTTTTYITITTTTTSTTTTTTTTTTSTTTTTTTTTTEVEVNSRCEEDQEVVQGARSRDQKSRETN